MSSILGTLLGSDGDSSSVTKANQEILVKTSGTATTTTSQEKSSTTTVSKDLDISSKSDTSKYKDKLIAYMKDMGAISGGAAILLNQNTSIDCIVLAALSIWQTRKGTTLAATKHNNPGCIPNSTENSNFADLTAGYASMIKQLESHLSDTDGKYLSSLRLLYVKRATSVEDAIGLESEDQKNLNAQDYDTSKSDAKTKLSEQQTWWLNKLIEIINDLYSNLLGATPAWQNRDISQKTTKSGNKTSPSDDGVKTKSMKPHGNHTDEIIVKLPENKTYAEPVYPDLITVADSVPQWIKTSSTVSGSDILSNLYDMTTSDDITSGKTSTATTSNGTSVTVESQGQTGETTVTLKSQAQTEETAEKQKTAETKTKQEEKAAQSNSSTSSNVDADTKQESTGNNTVNQTTPSEPRVNNTTVSSSAGNSTLKTINDLSNNQLSEVLGNQNDRIARQIVYDPSEHRNSFKTPSKGKPANNNDAFPVDLKIEELELHYPHAYIHELQCCPQGLTVGKALLQHASNVEKRIVRLENNMATLMRYTFAMGGRIFVNCVYYGGQSAYNKYKCIRCLKDNRLDDGQLMSIDQCFNCTRFEPNIGAVYEILNDKGSNLAQIMDDNQMGYSNMQEYTKFVKTDKYNAQLEETGTDVNSIKTKSSEYQDFSSVWSQGIKMNWSLVPVEDQVPHIGWRQSIRDDGSSLRANKLASYQYSATNMGSAISGNSANSIWKINRDAMDSNQEQSLSQFISAGKAYVSAAIQDTVNGMKAKDWMKSVKTQCSSAGIKLSPTALGVLAIADDSSGNISSVISKVQKIESALSGDNIDNQIITVTCYGLSDGTQYFLSSSSKAVDKLAVKGTNDTSNAQTSALDRAKISAWKWVEFAPYIAKLSQGGLDMCPKVCYAYNELNSYASISRFDTELWGFPFTDEQIDTGDITFSSGFGYRVSSDTNHHGVDLACSMGTEFRCAVDGTVHNSYNWDGVGLILEIKGPGNYNCRYMHMESVVVNIGDTVTRGQVLGYSGNGFGNYAPHLHVELIDDGSWNGTVDPAGDGGWPLLGSKGIAGTISPNGTGQEYNLADY